MLLPLLQNIDRFCIFLLVGFLLSFAFDIFLERQCVTLCCDSFVYKCVYCNDTGMRPCCCVL